MMMSNMDALFSQLNPIKVRFKFLLGELRLGDWFPRLCVIDASKLDDLSKDALNKLLTLHLPDHADGYYLHRFSIDTFQLGISRHGEWLFYKLRNERRYLVELSGTFNEYLDRRSAKSRNKIKRAVKKILDQYPDALQIATTPSQIIEFYQQAVEISNQTYQEKLLGSGLPKNEEFLLSMQEYAESGKARGYLLLYQGTPIAYAWCTANENAVNYQVVGYLPEWSFLSPGTVLLYLIIEDLFEHDEYSVLDFGPGESVYKSSFSTTSIEYADIFIFKCCWRNRILVWLHWKVECTSTLIGKCLENVGLKNLVKKIMRRWCPFGSRNN